MAEKTKKDFSESLLVGEQLEHYQYFKKRIQRLQNHRKNHYGINLDEIWMEADKAYIPHRLKTKGKRAVVTDEETLAQRVRELREYGWRERYVSHVTGSNSRLDELQAAILRVKLPHLDRRNEHRRTIATRYRQAIHCTELAAPAVIPGTTHSMHLFVLECEVRSALEESFLRSGVRTGRHYPMPVHRQPAYAGRIRGEDHLPVTERLADHILTLPCFPEQREDQVQRVCDILRAWPDASLQVQYTAIPQRFARIGQ